MDFNGHFIVVKNLTAEGILGLDVLKEHYKIREPQTKSQPSSSKQFTYLHDVRKKC